MTINAPLFSLVTVTLNNLKGLQKTYDLVKAQTCSDYEWLVIDGESTDGTIDFLKNTEANYTSEKDSGIYDAMNKGIERATGQYIIFMNAGDALESKATLDEISARLKDQSYDFLYGDSAEDIDGQLYFKRARLHHKITEGMFTHHQAMIYSKKILQDLRYDTSYQIASDYDLTWNVLNKSKNILYLPFPICLFEAGGVSQQQVVAGRKEQFKIRQNHGVAILKNIWIFVKQSLVYGLRCVAPKLYWLLKR